MVGADLLEETFVLALSLGLNWWGHAFQDIDLSLMHAACHGICVVFSFLFFGPKFWS